MKALNKQSKIVVGIIALVLVLTVGYALFSESLNINGTAKASGEFGIRFVSVGTITGEGSKDIANAKGEISTPNGEKLTISGVTLDYPTAYVNIPAVIENTGNIDAKVKGIDITGLDDPDIEVSYSGVHQDQILKSKDTVPITVKIEWRKESTVTSKVLNFTIDINYEQVTGQEITNPPKDTYAIGDTIKLGNEEFIVIEDSPSDKTTVTALAKYNLKVGNNVVVSDPERGDIVSNTPIDTASEGYGLQNKDYKGALLTSTNWNGVIAFSDTNYWAGESYDKPLPKYGDSYPANVFDKNSKLYTHVKNYENHLRKKLGYDSVRASLMTYKQFTDLGCDPSNYECTTNAPSWVYDTTYWGASADNDYDVWNVYSFGSFNSSSFGIDGILGVRPVITISKSEI